jgi:GTP-binding protein HflX
MEKSFLVGVFDDRKPELDINLILDELESLTVSAGGQVIDKFYQRKKYFDPKYLLGKGKAAEIKNKASEKKINLIIFYNQLTNVQRRNLENFFDLKVVDRTQLILDVFSTRARSLEGKLQVELAQLFYLLPRLTGKGVALSRLGGGIGTRGPGETKLEADRRRIKKRISFISDRLKRVIKNRGIQRKKRQSFPVPVVSLVGYTSAGKSTLFRSLTGEDVFISHQLFSTLDPLLRRVDLNEIEPGYYMLLSDTVGFIREMPRELFESFKATLEEIVQADIILHVVDISSPDYLNQKIEVENVLKELKIPEAKVITVYNKIDLLPGTDGRNPDDAGLPEFSSQPGAGSPENPLDSVRLSRVFMSAKEGWGIRKLKSLIHSKYFKDYRKFTISVPAHLINLNSVRNWAIVTHQHSENDVAVLEVLCSNENMLKFKENFGGVVK